MPVDLGDWTAEAVDHDPFADGSGGDPLGSSVTLAADQPPPTIAGHVAATPDADTLMTPQYLAAHPQGTLAPYNPSWSEAIQQGASEAAQSAGVPVEGAERLGGTLRAGAEMAPVSGNILQANEAYRAGQSGDPWSAALHAAMALPIPGASAEEGAAERALTPSGFYSHGAETAAALPQETGTAGQFLAALRSKGVKSDEISRTGMDMIPADTKMNKADVAEGFQMAMPDIRETRLAEPSTDTLLAAAKANFAQTIAARNGMTWEQLPAGSQANYLRWAREGSLDNAPRFQDWSTPGGSNYRELLMHLPDVRTPDDAAGPRVNFTHAHWDTPNVLAHLRMMDRQGPNGENLLHLDELQSDWGQATRRFSQQPQEAQDAANYDDLYQQLSGRLQDQNISLDTRYGHARIPDTHSLREWGGARAIDPDELDPATRALWDRFNAAAAYRAANSFRVRDSGPPSGPFVGSTQSWTDLGLKRALTEAARGNYDGMIWTPGQDQADRYGLEKHFSSLVLHDNDSGGIGRPQMEGPFRAGNLTGYDPNGREIVNQWVNEDQLRAHVGDEIANRLLATQPTAARFAGIGVRQRSLSGLDLRTGGEGMKGYYDNILPNRLKALTKKLDPSAKIGTTTLPDPVAGGRYYVPVQNDLGQWEVHDEMGDDLGVSAHRNAEEARIVADTLNRQNVKTKSYPHIPITPLMRERILKGFAQYADGGPVPEDVDETELTPVDHDPFAGAPASSPAAGLGAVAAPDPVQQSLDPQTPSSAGQPPMSQADRDALIRTVAGEAGGEPAQGQAAVAHAILNRVAAGGYGDSIHDVVTAPIKPGSQYHEFSVWNPPGTRESSATTHSLSPNDPSYARIGDIVDKAYSGLIPDPTGGATHYYAPRSMPGGRAPPWAAALAKDNSVTIGHQVFVGRSRGPGQRLPSAIAGGPQDEGVAGT
jgi:hypothetical protein